MLSFSWGISIGVNLEGVVINRSLEQTAVACPEESSQRC